MKYFFKYLNFTWLILFFCTNSFSQNSSLLKKVLESPIDNALKVKKADSLIKRFTEEKSDSLAYIYSDYAYYLYNIVHIDKIILYAEKALVSIQKTSPNNINKIQLFSSDLAYYYRVNNQTIEAFNLYKKVIHYDNSGNRIFLSYLELADIYYLYFKDYHKAQEYYKIAISLILKSNKEQDLIFLIDTHANFMYANYFINTPQSLKEGFKYGKVADSLSKLINTSLKDKITIKRGLALSTTSEENFNFKVAYKYYNEALEIAKNTNNPYYFVSTYIGLGNLYKTIDQEKSIKYYEKAASLTKDKDTLGSLYYSMGQTYTIKKEYTTSLNYKHKALKYKTGNDFLDLKTINNELLTTNKNKSALLINVQQLAQTYLNYYNQENNIEFVKKSIAYFKMCDVLIDALKTDSNGFKSRLYWRELSTDIYGKAIKACYLNNDLESAFYFMEKNKALLLLEDISRNKIKETLNLDPKILIKEKELIQQLAIVNDALTNEAILSQSEIDSLKKQRVDLDIERDILLKDVPIRTLNIEAAIVTLEDFQSKLNDNEVVIEFHMSTDDGYGTYTNKENGYVLVITKKNTQLFEINNLSDLEKDVISYTKLLKNPFKTDQDKNEFNQLSHHLYNRLLPSEGIKQLIKEKQTTIIPDRYLSFLPFETLSTSADAISYLIKDTQIHYSYSNSFSQTTKRPKQSNVKSFAIAPVNFKDKQLPRLENSKQEIEYIQNFYPGVHQTDETASKTNFLNNLTSSNIIHIASHANAQDKTAPWIAFNDEKITLEELYLTQNNASLVVLSACNTSLGEQAIGEGIMSLARGFFYSGSQSVVSSLWSIDDKSTSEIVNTFYKNLSDGQTKATALHNAKLNYLNNHNLSETSPYYWSALILLGENDVLLNPKTPWFIYLIGILIIGMILLFFIKRKQSQLK